MIAWSRTFKALPASFAEYGLYEKNSKQRGLRIYILSVKNLPWFFRFAIFTLRKQDFTTVKSAKLCDTPSRFQPNFFSKVPWLSLAFWDSSSLTFPDFSQKWITRFTHLNPMSLKVIQGENLHNFKEILLMMYVYHKAAFTFEERFSTFTYDARRMCFNFTHILMIIVGTIDLHNSLQTFSIRVVWRRKQFRTFWS